MVKIVAIIPARGGSKRIKNKNIKNFYGKPMIAWTIIAAIKSKIFKRVVVSTDDIKIAEIAEKYGAEVPFLRKEFNDDYSPISEATISTLKNIKKYWNEEYDIVVQLMANCPLRNEKDIKKSFNKFKIKKRTFQISCFKFGWMNPWWAFKLDKRNKSKALFPKQLTKRSQDLPNLYCPTGAIWIAKTKDLIRNKTFYGKGYCFEEINWINAIDIDDYEDLEFAKILKKFRVKI